MTRPILFLDFDGVVNNIDTWANHRPQRGNYIAKTHVSDPELVARVRRIVEATNAIVVISSTWRKNCTRRRVVQLIGKGDNWLTRYMLRGKHWRTVSTNKGYRGEEVRIWFRDNPHHAGWPYAILDDDGDFYPDQPLVKTHCHVGIQDEHVERAIQIMTGTA